jgi:hypothetical protein
VGPQDPKEVTRDTTRDLSGLAGELAAHCTAAIEQFGFEFLSVTFNNVYDPST